MEDVTVVFDKFLDDPRKGFFAVYDGHGGVEVARRVGKTLHGFLANELRPFTESALTPSVVEAAVHAATEQCIADLSKFPSAGTQGCTMCMCIVDRAPSKQAPLGRLFFASLGDSRAVMLRGKKAVRMTEDHKPTSESERRRIHSAGGCIVSGRIFGIISVSRSLGDTQLRPFISSEPYFNCTRIDANDVLVLIACDGVWDVICDRDAAREVKRVWKETGSAARACGALTKLAIDRDTSDNISVLGLFLKR